MNSRAISSKQVLRASPDSSSRVHYPTPSGNARPMFDIVLYEPEIPPNTGNVIRLAVNTGARLHLVKPLGFSVSHKQLARAGMDYREFADVTVHDDWTRCHTHFAGQRLFAVTTR